MRLVHPTPLRSILILSPSTSRNSKWCTSLLPLPHQNNACIFLFCHLCYTCHNPFTLPDLSTPITFAEQRRSWSSPLHKCSPTASCFLPLSSEYYQHLLSRRSCFPGAFAKFRKATIGLASLYLSVCLSVGQHGTARLPLDAFSRNLIFEYFSIVCPENLSVTEIWHE